MKGKVLKIIYWVAGIIFVILAFLCFLGVYGYKIQNYFMEKSQEKYLAEVEKYKAELLEAQKNDNYGGKTPEETLDLYIKALKAGDIELASKYLEISIENPNLQNKELEDLNRLIKKDGSLSVVLDNMDNIFKRGIKKVWSDTEISFLYYYITTEESTSTSFISGQEIITVRPVGIEEKIGVSLKLNPFTKVWKINQ